jgi:uncharacterized oxidoreductase
MNTQNKKVLVTGGGSGIGLAIAKAFSDAGNQVIITGRREEVLKTAVASLKNATYVVSDVTSAADVDALVQKIETEYKGLDILVNNAGTGRPQQLDVSVDIYETARFEMDINYLSVIRLTEKLLPALRQSKEAAIINIQSIVSYVPSINLPTYSASKFALHAYSQALRLTLQVSNTSIKVFEVFPPFVDTDLTRSIDVEKLAPAEVAQDILQGVRLDEFAIRNGKTKDLYGLVRQSPETALLKMNGIE